MEKVQSNLLKAYRQARPHFGLREMSKETGIQLTRMHRLLNGSEMKVKELRIIQELLNQEKGEELSSFLHMAEECADKLNSTVLDKLIAQMKRELHLLKLKERLQFA